MNNAKVRCVECPEHKIIPEGMVGKFPIVVRCRVLSRNIGAYTFCVVGLMPDGVQIIGV